MKHIGYSVYNTHYSIFNFQSPKSRLRSASLLDLQFLINNLGTFSVPLDYYDAFKVLGSFLSGQDSILFKWAEFSVRASGKNLSIESVVNEVLRSPITERDITESKKIYNSISGSGSGRFVNHSDSIFTSKLFFWIGARPHYNSQ